MPGAAETGIVATWFENVGKYMSTTMDLTLSELRFFLNHISLPAETRLRVTFDDDNEVLEMQRHNEAIAAMEKLRGSGNGNLIDSLLRYREEDKKK